ncbi:SDR family oxidoreductase [Kribbella capetownensis]|uniref:SDR family oxidoreductase n=1 Tax=Kribbella capetownensis TaxID=1572659 RepID=A0A4R0JJS8_9ACTN|nr:SDR family oxidoreductase [Kribbella capetownensis]TCC44978.1 SDR family oxidoreductase [Kribbella capetownensis]
MTAQLDGSTALVTGGNSGIGRAIALDLAKHGAHVIVSGRDAARAEEVVATIRAAGGKADFVAAGLSDEASARELARRATELGGGRIDILVNNAGIYPYGPTAETTQDVFENVYDINVKAPYFLVAALAPQMAERGKGAIVNIATMVAHYGDAGYALYGSSKAALLLLTKAWAAEYGPSGVRVNAVSPGPTRTEGTSGYGDALDKLAATTPHGRPGLPEEIATAVTFLVSDDARYIHGAQLPVDGGRIAV